MGDRFISIGLRDCDWPFFSVSSIAIPHPVIF